MSNFRVLYNTRLSAGQRRQLRHAAALRALDRTLVVAKKDHSYGEYDRALNDQLMKKRSFSGGSRGYLGRLADDAFLYRLVGIKKLANDKTVNWISHVKPGSSPSDLFRMVSRAYKRLGDWIPLRRFARGNLSGYRNLTFWTTHPLDPSRIVSDVHLIGITNNWLNEWSVIMRCRAKDMVGHTSVRVPTVLDAFTELIFHPTTDSPRPTSGNTIEISAAPLTTGAEEFALGPVGVEKVQIVPCFINNKSAPCVHSKDLRLLNLLDAHYRLL